MKQKDIALLAVVVVLSAIVSLFLTKLLFGGKLGKQDVEVVQPISSSFSTADKTYINTSAYDPTQLIQIGNNNNTNPFSAAQ